MLGFSDTAYIPVAGGVPTIGFGSTDGVEIGDKISVQEALERLVRDVGNAEGASGQCVKVPLSQGEYDAYTSFAFNVGIKAFCGSTLVKKLNAGDYSGACEELKRWGYVKGEFSNGLANRRERGNTRCVLGRR